MVLGSFGVLLASVILIINSKRSLVDYVGKTKLVKIDEDNTTTKTIIDDNDYDDLSDVYIKREEIDSKDDNSSNNYNDQSDDDYKVF